jgi:hypothetical protein
MNGKIRERPGQIDKWWFKRDIRNCRAQNMPGLLENETGDLAKSGEKREFIKSLLIWKLFTYSSVQKKENCVSLTRLNFQAA